MLNEIYLDANACCCCWNRACCCERWLKCVSSRIVSLPASCRSAKSRSCSKANKKKTSSTLSLVIICLFVHVFQIYIYVFFFCSDYDGFFCFCFSRSQNKQKFKSWRRNSSTIFVAIMRSKQISRNSTRESHCSLRIVAIFRLLLLFLKYTKLI